MPMAEIASADFGWRIGIAALSSVVGIAALWRGLRDAPRARGRLPRRSMLVLGCLALAAAGYQLFAVFNAQGWLVQVFAGLQVVLAVVLVLSLWLERRKTI